MPYLALDMSERAGAIVNYHSVPGLASEQPSDIFVIAT